MKSFPKCVVFIPGCVPVALKQTDYDDDSYAGECPKDILIAMVGHGEPESSLRLTAVLFPGETSLELSSKMGAVHAMWRQSSFSAIRLDKDGKPERPF